MLPSSRMEILIDVFHKGSGDSCLCCGNEMEGSCCLTEDAHGDSAAILV